MKKKILTVLIIGIAIIGAIFGFRSFTATKKNSSKNELVLYGNVDIREVNLAFNASERIVEIYVEEGEQVKKDQTLARLKNDVMKLAVLRNEARVNAQKEMVRELESGTRKEEIQKAKAEVEAARKKAVNAERTYDRLKSLANKDLASQQAADDAEAAAEITAAQWKAARESLNLALAGPREEKIAAARQNLHMYEAELEIARRNLEDSVLYAPSEGVVRNRVLHVGDMAFPQRTVLTLALTNPVWVRTYIPEPELGKISEGMRATVKTDSFPGKSYDGWVGYISPTSEFTPKNVHTPELRTQLVYEVRIFVKNPENQLRLGMPATVAIPLDQSRSGGLTSRNKTDER